MRKQRNSQKRSQSSTNNWGSWSRVSPLQSSFSQWSGSLWTTLGTKHWTAKPKRLKIQTRWGTPLRLLTPKLRTTALSWLCSFSLISSPPGLTNIPNTLQGTDMIKWATSSRELFSSFMTLKWYSYLLASSARCTYLANTWSKFFTLLFYL